MTFAPTIRVTTQRELHSVSLLLLSPALDRPKHFLIDTEVTLTFVSMAPLTSFRLLCFDVYGTLIDQNTGILNSLYTSIPGLKSAPIPERKILEIFNKHEKAQQSKTPTLPFSKLLATIHPFVASELGLPAPSASDSEKFGESVGSWPAFPDTVEALKRLHKYYKLVVLSNVDRESFSRTNSGPLKGFDFDAILTAQDIGSYKPDPRNFEYMLKEVEKRFGVKREEVIQTAQSQFHDHQPARKLGINSAWIVRSSAVKGDVQKEGLIYDWRFDTLGDMADAVEKEGEGQS